MDPGPSHRQFTGSSTIHNNSIAGSNPVVIHNVGIYGWRKRCLYMLVVIILIMVILNMALLIWMLRVMDFNVHGMGKLRILDNGIKVDGDATFLKALHASHIQSLKTSSLHITSTKNISINARSKDGSIENKVFIGNNKFSVYAKEFLVKDNKGKQLFHAGDDTITLGAKTLYIDGEDGTIFKSSVETPLLRSHLNADLRLESATRGVFLKALDDVTVHTPVGHLHMKSYSDISIQSINRAIRLEAQNISLKGLPRSPPDTGRGHYTLVYQLCVCGNNGKLFLSQAEGRCIATKEICS